MLPAVAPGLDGVAHQAQSVTGPPDQTARPDDQPARPADLPAPVRRSAGVLGPGAPVVEYPVQVGGEPARGGPAEHPRVHRPGTGGQRTEHVRHQLGRGSPSAPAPARPARHRSPPRPVRARRSSASRVSAVWLSVPSPARATTTAGAPSDTARSASVHGSPDGRSPIGTSSPPAPSTRTRSCLSASARIASTHVVQLQRRQLGDPGRGQRGERVRVAGQGATVGGAASRVTRRCRRARRWPYPSGPA